MSGTTSSRNTLGLGRNELIKLLNELDQGASNDHASRVYARWPYRVLWLDVRLEHPGGTDIDVRIACRNLSSGGVGLLHNSYVYEGTMCTVQLPHPGKKLVPVQGRVVRCQHVKGTIHEVGVEFETPVDPREFVPKAKTVGRYTRETVEADKLQGRMLYADPSEMNQNIVGHFLRETGMAIKSALTADEAIEAAKAGVDVLLIEEQVGEVSGVDLVRTLRSKGVRAPCIMTSVDGNCLSESVFAEGLISAFLPKPIQAPMLLRAIDDFLGAKAGQDDGEPQELSRAEVELREMFKEQAGELVAKLERACEAADGSDLYKLCLQIKGTAPAVGLIDLGQLAGVISAQLETSEAVEQVQAQVAEMLMLCRQVAAGEAG